jgi:hypothetical protein
MPAKLEIDVRSPSEQLRRILSSRTFRNTEVLKRLLEYLGRKAVAGEGEELKEYIVGVEAFGKNADYDPKVDSVVRVQAGKLRHKLEEYYRTEGREDRVIVELPKGCFALEFREQDREPASLPMVPVPPAESGGRKLGPWLVAAVSLVVAAAALLYSLTAPRGPAMPSRYMHPAVAELWAPFATSSRPAVISLGAPLFAKVAGRFVRYTILNDWDEMVSSGEAKIYEDLLREKSYPSYVYSGIGEAAGVFELGRLFLSLGKDVDLLPSNTLTWEDIERNDVIFVGPPKYNRQAADVLVSREFEFQKGRIVNLRPRDNERRYFEQTYSADGQNVIEGHAVIARLPGLHGAGLTMLLAGASTEGSRAAVDYATRPEYVTKLVASLKGSRGRIPMYFECVIRAKFKFQTPIQIEQVALRTRND